MEAAASLRQTVTHLFDAVRFSDHAREMEEAARRSETNLDLQLSKLESQTEELSNLLASMKTGSEEAARELSRQLEEFLETAKQQAKSKLERKAREELEEYRNTAASEKDKALKSLESYLAADPLPIIENIVQVRLSEGAYEARSRYECEGGIKYDFRLASQNSRLFHQELSLSQLGYELKVPVRFSKALLKKNRTPGFERLDQYVLTSAETSGGRLRATFQKAGDEPKLKVVTSGSEANGFIGLEYTDRTQAVNVMNDPSLSAYVDLGVIRQATDELVAELADLSKKKVALLRLSLDGEEPVESLNCNAILQTVLKVLGPSYRSLVKEISEGFAEDSEGLSISFIQERLKVLGELSASVLRALGPQYLQ
jgi:hypothetical protein